MPVISDPNPDLELGIARSPLSYALVLPETGIGPRTGLIFYIHGFGSTFDDSYSQKLLPYLANTHDCIAVAVGYHGAFAQSYIPLCFAPDFFVQLREHHGVTVSAAPGLNDAVFRTALFQTLAEKGISKLHPACRLLKRGESYINFGLLPALDHLQVAADILRQYPLDRRRLFVLGTSYGGYVGLLMTKIAPNTFRMVVDNCGYCGVEGPQEGVVYGVTTVVGAVRVSAISTQAFSLDPGARNYFSPAHALVRNIGVAEHYPSAGTTVSYSYHGLNDKISLTDTKIETSRVLCLVGRRHDLRLIGEGDIDGRLFKSATHGLEASMRGLFDLSYDRWLAEASDVPEITDFDLGTVTTLACADFDYVFSFSPDGVRLNIC